MKKSKEEKMLEKAEKEFTKQKKALEKIGLNFAEYDIDTIDKLNGDSARKISSDLAGLSWYMFGDALAGRNANETFKMNMARAQVEENLMIIRQNEIIIRLLSKLVDSEN